MTRPAPKAKRPPRDVYLAVVERDRLRHDVAELEQRLSEAEAATYRETSRANKAERDCNTLLHALGVMAHLAEGLS